MRDDDLAVAEEAGADAVVRVGDQRLEGERARGGIGGRADAAHLPGEGLAREGVDAHAHPLPGAERRHVALGDLAAELERVVLDDAEEDRSRPHVIPRIDQARRDRAVHGRADLRVLELDAELVAPGARDVERHAHLLVLLRRDDAAGAQRLGARRVAGRLGEAGLRLAQPGLDLVAPHAGEHVALGHAVAQIGQDRGHLPLHLARHLGLRVGGERADDRDGALDRAHGDVRDRDGDRLGLGGSTRRLGRRAPAAAGRERRQEPQGNEPPHAAPRCRRSAAGAPMPCR